MAESRSFSIGVDALINAVRPYGGLAEPCFPPGLGDARRKSGESLRAWFVRLVDQFCGGDPQRVALENNLAVFVRLRWEGRNQLSYANIQTLKTACGLDEYYLGAEAEAAYLRLDFDYTSLGEPFSHPLAHIHVEGEQSPRFALEGGDCGNIVVDYLEFLYRNYFPAEWLRWVDRVWADEFKKTAVEGTVDPLPTIIEAFISGQFQTLRDYSSDLTRVKRALRKRKDSIFDLHMPGADRLILEYPAAR